MKISINFPPLLLLTILFIGLKLTNYINWSWFYVLSPILFPILLFIAILILFFIGIAIEEVLNYNKKNKH
jgi:hypothetical protein